MLLYIEYTYYCSIRALLQLILIINDNNDIMIIIFIVIHAVVTIHVFVVESQDLGRDRWTT